MSSRGLILLLLLLLLLLHRHYLWDVREWAKERVVIILKKEIMLKLELDTESMFITNASSKIASPFILLILNHPFKNIA